MSHSNTAQPLNALPFEVQQFLGFKLNFKVTKSWEQYIKRKTGLPDLIGIAILKDLVYRYTPVPVYGENRELLGYKKRFEGDLFEQTYRMLAHWHNITWRQARYICDLLKELGLIKIVIDRRGERLTNGEINYTGNIPYMVPVFEKIVEITDPEIAYRCKKKQRHPSDAERQLNTKYYENNICTVVSEIAESDSVVPVEEDKIAPPIPLVEEQEKKQILQELKSLVLWNPVLQKLVDTTEAAVLKEAAKVVKRKAKVDQPGGGFLTSVIRNIKAGITQQKLTGRTPSVKALNKMPPGAQIWLENEGYFTAAILERVYSETIECTIDGQWKEYPIDKVRLFPDGYNPPEHPEATAKRQLIQQRLAELKNMEIGALIGGYLGYGQMREIGFYEGMDTDAKTPSIKIRSVKFGTIESVPVETIFTPDMIEYGERIYCETDPETIPLTDETMHLLKRGDVVIVRNDRGFFYQFEITDMRRRNTGELLCNLKSQFVEFYISSDRVLIPHHPRNFGNGSD